MTLAAATPIARFTGNGTTTAFALSHPVYELDDVVVTVYDTTPAAVSVTKDGSATYDYTVTGTLDSSLGYYNGVTVTFNTAPPTDYKVALTRSNDLVQELSLSEGSAFQAKSLEHRLDQIVAQNQDLTEQLARAPVEDPALQQHTSDMTFDGVATVTGLPNPSATTDAVNKAYLDTAVAALADPVTYSVVDTATATDGQTAFTVSTYVPGVNSILVFRQGVLQSLGAGDYTETDGTTITLSTAAVAGEKLIFVRDMRQASGGTADAANVTFEHSGSGASSTNVQAVLQTFAHTPEQYGAVGDNSTDDLTAVQAASDAGEGGLVWFPGTYYVSNSVKLHSRTVYYGNGTGTGQCLIRGDGDYPVLASKNYFSTHSLSPTGWCQVRNLRIQGSNNAAHTANHGLLLRDYYSLIEDVEVYQPGADGIVWAEENDASTAASSLVENRMSRCVVRSAGGISFRVADSVGNVLTDGHANDLISQSPGSAHFDGYWAGWKVSRVHGYGGTPSIGARFRSGFELQLSDIRIASGVDFGVVLGSLDRAVQVSNLSIEYDSNNASYVGLFLSNSGATTPTVHISGLKFQRDTGTNAYTAISIGSNVTLDLAGVPPVFAGSSVATNRTVWSLSGTLKGYMERGVTQMASGTAAVTLDLAMPNSGYGVTFGSDTAGNISWSSKTAAGFTITHSGGGTEFVAWEAFEV